MENNIAPNVEEDIKNNIEDFKIQSVGENLQKQTVSVLKEDEITPEHSQDVDSLYKNKSKFSKKYYYLNNFKVNSNDSLDKISLELNNESNNHQILNDINTNSESNGHKKESESSILDTTNSNLEANPFDSTDKLQLVKELKELKLSLEEKEVHLETAAKYGITLLQSNESLQALLDKKEEEVKTRIEEANDEKHVLKMQLDCERLQHESLAGELRNDLVSLRASMEEERKEMKGVEKNLNDKIKDMTHTNENLTDQILNASLQEEESMSQVSNLRLQVSETGVEQENHLHNLQDEISELKVERDRMLRLKTEECRLLNTTLDQAQERLVSMEKERISETIRAEQLQMELTRLEDKYVVLLSKVESNSQSDDEVGGANFNEMSLFAELDVLSDAVHAHELINGRNSISGKSSLGTQLRQEILEVYRQVQRLIMEVKGQGDQWSPEVVDINDLKAGQLLFALTQLHQLLNRRFHTDSLPPLSDEQSKLEGQVSYLREQGSILREQLFSTQKTLDSVKGELAVRDQQLQRSHDHKTALEKNLKEYRENLCSLQSTIDLLKRVEAPPDSLLLIQELRHERNQVAKKSVGYEDELTTLRLDMRDLDRQLMESVEQKLQLSNQLEAWQNDMHELIENKMAGEIERDSLRSTLKPQLSLSSSSSSSLSNPIRSSSFKKRFSLKWA